MGHFPCTNCWKTSEDQQVDDKSTHEIYNNETAPYWALEDGAKSRESLCLNAKSVESPVASVTYGSVDAIGEPWRSEKSDDVIAKSTSSDPHLNIFLKTGEKPEDFLDNSLLKSPLSIGIYNKKMGGKESPAKNLWIRSAPIAAPTTTRSWKNGSSCSPFARKQHTVISDWGDVYEGLTPFQSPSGSVIIPRCLSSSFSDQETAGDTCSLDFSSSRLKKITLLPGNVMGMLLCKNDYRFQMLNINWSMKEVVDLFLVIECGASLPINFSNDGLKRPRIMSNSQMQMTIAESLGPQFDVKTQGLAFATGSINSRLCYKMSVCQLSTMEKIFFIFGTDKISQKSSSYGKQI